MTRALLIGTGLGTLLLAAPALAQLSMPAAKPEASCDAGPGQPCHAGIDFEAQSRFTIRARGSTAVHFVNEGNRRCRLEYSAADASSATAGRFLDLGPSGDMEIPLNGGPMQIQFVNRGLGSVACTLLVQVKEH
jgi:hypothetical protein